MATAGQSVQLEGCSRWATLLLFREVTNAREVRLAAVQGKTRSALLDPSVLVSPFQVLVAVNKAVNNEDRRHLITKNVFSEIIFSLSPSNSISDSFKQFGIKDASESILAVLLSTEPDNATQIGQLKNMVQGRLVSLQEMSTLTDHSFVRKLYNISNEELKFSSVENSVATQIAVKSVS